MIHPLRTHQIKNTFHFSVWNQAKNNHRHGVLTHCNGFWHFFLSWNHPAVTKIVRFEK